LGRRLAAGLAPLVGAGATATRVHGLWAGVDLPDTGPTARSVCERLLERGVLAKDAHGHTLRLAPPIVISEHDLDFAIEQLVDAVRPREHALS
jgi:ornithine--oxo-acid transaminase